MRIAKKILLTILFFALLLLNSPGFVLNGWVQGSTSSSKATTNTYNGILKIKSSKYGIVIKKAGMEKYVVFDANGQKLVKKLKSEEGLKEGTEIIAKGVIKNNILQVKAIEKKIKPVAEQTFTGWLGDSDCSPNLEDPSEMGFKCLKCPHCEASGYGISVKKPDGKYKYYKFNKKGHQLAKENIVAKLTQKKVPRIVVKGTISENIINVNSISIKT